MDEKRYSPEELKEVDPELYEQVMFHKRRNQERAAKEQAIANSFWDAIEKLEDSKKEL